MKGSPGKAFTIQWYFKDWLSDKNLQVCSAATRGIWINLLMYMYDCSFDDPEACEVGIMEVSTFEISRLGGCTIEEAENFILDAMRHKFCNIEPVVGGDHMGTTHDHDVGGCPKNVRIMSRRINREAERRLKWRNDKRKQRGPDEPIDDVSALSAPRARVPSPSPSPTPKALKKKAAFFEIPGAELIADAAPSKIKELTEEICQKLKDDNIFSNVRSFVTQSLKEPSTNERALLHSLIRTYAKREFKKGPWSYARRVLEIENGNFNERENMKG
jgi:hypothetical protein